MSESLQRTEYTWLNERLASTACDWFLEPAPSGHRWYSTGTSVATSALAAAFSSGQCNTPKPCEGIRCSAGGQTHEPGKVFIQLKHSHLTEKQQRKRA